MVAIVLSRPTRAPRHVALTRRPGMKARKAALATILLGAAMTLPALARTAEPDPLDPAHGVSLPCESLSTPGLVPRSAKNIAHVANVCGFVGTDIEFQSRTAERRPARLRVRRDDGRGPADLRHHQPGPADGGRRLFRSRLGGRHPGLGRPRRHRRRPDRGHAEDVRLPRAAQRGRWRHRRPAPRLRSRDRAVHDPPRRVRAESRGRRRAQRPDPPERPVGRDDEPARRRLDRHRRPAQRPDAAHVPLRPERQPDERVVPGVAASRSRASRSAGAATGARTTSISRRTARPPTRPTSATTP